MSTQKEEEKEDEQISREEQELEDEEKYDGLYLRRIYSYCILLIRKFLL